MAPHQQYSLQLFILFTFFLHFSIFTNSQSFIGVNYGQVADNLPPPEATAKLLQSTSIGKVRMYGADPAIIHALANTGIGIVIGAANGDIPALASDPKYATQWVNSNVLAYPDSNIIVITVGNEVMIAVDQSLVSLCLPAMQNVQNALNAVGRPRKQRKKSATEAASANMVKNGKLTRKGKTITCGKCGNKGHNSANCKGQSQSSAGVKRSRKGDGSGPSQSQGDPTQPSQSQGDPTQPSQSQGDPTQPSQSAGAKRSRKSKQTVGAGAKRTRKSKQTVGAGAVASEGDPGTQ